MYYRTDSCAFDSLASWPIAAVLLGCALSGNFFLNPANHQCTGCFGGSHLELFTLWRADENRRSPQRCGVRLPVQFLRQFVAAAPIGPMTCVRVPAWSCVYGLISAAWLPAPGSLWLSNITNGHLADSTRRPFPRTPSRQFS
jgi:hypothetical protein